MSHKEECCIKSEPDSDDHPCVIANLKPKDVNMQLKHHSINVKPEIDSENLYIQSEEIHIKDEPAEMAAHQNAGGQHDDFMDTKHKQTHIKDEPLIMSRAKDDGDENLDELPGTEELNENSNAHLKYNCSECIFIGKPSDLKKHMKRIHGDKPHACTFCELKYAHKKNLKLHMQLHTGEKQLQKCDFCEYRTAQKDYLRVHMQTHTGEKPHACHLCDYRSARKTTLQEHLRCKHSGEKPYKCDLCKHTTANIREFRRHVRVHTGEIFYKCLLCDYTCNTKPLLRAHRLRHFE